MESPHRSPADSDLLHEAGARLRRWWPAKMAGTVLGLAGFFVAYFWILEHPSYPVTIMPLTAIDGRISFQPWTLPLYLSLWFYVSLAPGLLVVRRELLSYGWATVALSVCGLGIFHFWPTAVPEPDVNWSQYPSFAFLRSADAAGNACPSLHVAFAVFSAIWFERLLRQMGARPVLRALSWLWCLGILYSTIATRQHVALDLVAGALLGALVAAAHLRWLRATPGADRPKPAASKPGLGGGEIGPRGGAGPTDGAPPAARPPGSENGDRNWAARLSRFAVARALAPHEPRRRSHARSRLLSHADLLRTAPTIRPAGLQCRTGRGMPEAPGL